MGNKASFSASLIVLSSQAPVVYRKTERKIEVAVGFQFVRSSVPT